MKFDKFADVFCKIADAHLVVLLSETSKLLKLLCVCLSTKLFFRIGLLGIFSILIVFDLREGVSGDLLLDQKLVVKFIFDLAPRFWAQFRL